MSRKGIPNFEATPQQRELVGMYSAVGISHEQIALIINHLGEPISVDTLTRHFPTELATGLSKTTAMVAGRLVRTALGNNDKALASDELRAQMFYLKTRAGWREVDRQEVVFPDAGEDEGDIAAVSSRVAGLIEKGLRRAAAKGALPKKDGETVQ